MATRPPRIERIVCAVDFLDESREVLRAAAEQAREHDAVLVLVHAWQPPLWLTEADYGMPGRVVQQTIETAEHTLEAWRRDALALGVPDVVAEFRTGLPWQQVVAAARADPRVGMIVIGTHGHTGLRRALMGSVAEKVVRHAPCTVLVVRAPAHAPASQEAGATPRAPASPRRAAP